MSWVPQSPLKAFRPVGYGARLTGLGAPAINKAQQAVIWGVLAVFGVPQPLAGILAFSWVP